MRTAPGSRGGGVHGCTAAQNSSGRVYWAATTPCRRRDGLSPIFRQATRPVGHHRPRPSPRVATVPPLSAVQRGQLHVRMRGQGEEGSGRRLPRLPPGTTFAVAGKGSGFWHALRSAFSARSLLFVCSTRVKGAYQHRPALPVFPCTGSSDHAHLPGPPARPEDPEKPEWQPRPGAQSREPEPPSSTSSFERAAWFIGLTMWTSNPASWERRRSSG
jgi:hypothetical protein